MKKRCPIFMRILRYLFVFVAFVLWRMKKHGKCFYITTYINYSTIILFLFILFIFNKYIERQLNKSPISLLKKIGITLMTCFFIGLSFGKISGVVKYTELISPDSRHKVVFYETDFFSAYGTIYERISPFFMTKIDSYFPYFAYQVDYGKYNIEWQHDGFLFYYWPDNSNTNNFASPETIIYAIHDEKK